MMQTRTIVSVQLILESVVLSPFFHWSLLVLCVAVHFDVAGAGLALVLLLMVSALLVPLILRVVYSLMLLLAFLHVRVSFAVLCVHRNSSSVKE